MTQNKDYIDVDEKLREILVIVHEGCKLARPCPVENQAIRAIEEVFKDEGYVKPPSEFSEWMIEVSTKGLKTGQEWLDRFIKELNNEISDGYDDDADTAYLFEETVIKLARKASGLSNDS